MVSKQKEDALRQKMEELGLNEVDIDETFIRCQGSGGQKVNKTSACVHLRHRPSGIEVKCHQDRSQALNRYHARAILVKKYEEMILGKQSEEQKRIEKIRRQKRKRSKRAKEKMLQDKHHQSEKKKLRSSPAGDSEG